jgi:radical SAM superfamily enzyme YgiQ (UPF0313 family)
MGEVPWDEVASSDLVGLSTITSTAPRTYEMADSLREIGVPTVLGGPHVTFLSEEGISHADYVIRGEAEKSLPLLVEAISGEREMAEVPGLTYKVNGETIDNPMDGDAMSLDELPEPDFTLLGTHYFKKKGWTKRVIPMQTSRGCPYNCNFCSVTEMFGRRMRYRSVDAIIDELKKYDDKKNSIFFYDDNFVANPKRTKELLRKMIGEGFQFVSSAQVRVDSGKDRELMRLMRDAGLKTVFIGLESVSPESLKGMKKKQTLEDMEDGLRGFREFGISVHGMFVFGFDQDEEKTFKETVKFARRNAIDSVQFLILTPLPGTPVYKDIEENGRIIIKDWSFYDGHHVVFNPKRIDPYCLQRAQIKGHRRFYSTLEVIRRFYRFDFFNAMIAAYAKRLSKTWVKENKLYLKVIKFLKPSAEYILSIDLRRKGTDVKEALTEALERASIKVRRATTMKYPVGDKPTVPKG